MYSKVNSCRCVNLPCEPPKRNGGEKSCCGFRAGILRRNYENVQKNRPQRLNGKKEHIWKQLVRSLFRMCDVL